MPSPSLSWIVLMTLLPFLYWYYSMLDHHCPHIPYPYTIGDHYAPRPLMFSSLGSLSLFSKAYKFFFWCREMCQVPTPPLMWHGNFHWMRSSGAAHRVMWRMSIEESLPLSSLVWISLAQSWMLKRSPRHSPVVERIVCWFQAAELA